ncbi:c-type cytochrome biogenesis protein CcmI [Methylobacterium sp. J-090]|uniref:c-type cytochrome biogenesis protein CcmI n=1 Tax=Methylobacterium sp. J-090 TaxID=2836666 RepID=UPI001FB888B4|nr:c-type cytochrome biogenesis protein CcmI [Methylobacterium sp. J-090]MCJ2080641.1 c-type cytochrome biogenesis protein CcmI [Methylobacterium sp. J-090]
MTALWFILAFMTGAAVLALLWPMSRRTNPSAAPDAGAMATETGFYEDQLREIERDLARGLIAAPEAEAARTEAGRRLLRANRVGVPLVPGIAEPALRQRRAASAFALSTIPLVALIAYGIYGSPHMPAQGAAERQAAENGGQELLNAIGQIEARLASNPTDGRGWAVLAPVYMRMGRFDDAAHAYEAAARTLGETPQRLSDWGEALIAGNNGVISPQAKTLFERAVALDGTAAKPRFYLARAAELDGDIPLAIERLDALAATATADAPWLPVVRDNLARLKGEAPPKSEAARPGAGAAPEPGAAASLQALPPEGRNAAIRGMVAGLDQRLSEKGGTADEWLRLVRSLAVLGDRDKAAGALVRARAALASDATALQGLDALAKEFGLTNPVEAGKTDPGTPDPAKADTAKTDPAKADRERGEAAKAGAKDATKDATRDGGTQNDAARAGTEAAVAAVKAMPAAERDAAIRGMVAGLDRRLAAKGGTIDDWLRLVRSYAVLGERTQALQALDRARMAQSPEPQAKERLDELGRELGLNAQPGP